MEHYSATAHSTHQTVIVAGVLW